MTTAINTNWIRRLLIGFIVSLALWPQLGHADDPTQKAVQRGAKYLSGLHQPASNYKGGTYGVGSASLVGLALLESNIGFEDAALKNLIAYVRANALSQTRTYEASLVIMILDRLGEEIDRPVIQFLAIRLLAGQNRLGGWTYDAGYKLPETETARIRKALYDDRFRSSNAPSKDPQSTPKIPSSTSENLHPEVVRFARWIALNTQDAGDNAGDNSNTQFAILALWIARKHGVQCDRALAAADKRFRNTQSIEGAWGYQPPPRNVTGDTSSMPGMEKSPAMTCSGLLALAAGRGIQISALRSKTAKQGPPPEMVAPANDKAVAAALKYVKDAISKSELPAKPVISPIGETGKGKLRENLYFLWSLERVAMIYDLEKIGALDWYEWGASHLIKTQDKDGSWSQTGYDGANAEINTAFALLFLNRANLARDLTATLKGKATVKLNLPDRANPEPSKVDPKQKSDPPLPTLSEDEFAAEANRLCNALVNADASSRAGILTRLRDSKGSVYTEALVRAIGKLKGEQQRTAREALALRLKRMTALTLRDMLKDANAEMRCAAAVACGLKGDKQHIPDLTAALRDTEEIVVQAARDSLRMLE
jgi:hypothetical protein